MPDVCCLVLQCGVYGGKSGNHMETDDRMVYYSFYQRESIIKVGVCFLSPFVFFLCSSILSSFLFLFFY